MQSGALQPVSKHTTKGIAMQRRRLLRWLIAGAVGAGISWESGAETANEIQRPLGKWPASPDTSIGLSVAQDVLTGKPLAKAYIGLAPTEDWTTIPAYLRWGGWNDCPAAEYHVAAMRTWRDRYGAELVGMSSDTINLRVATRPKTRKRPSRSLAINTPTVLTSSIRASGRTARLPPI